MPEQIDTQIKEERFHELMSLQAQISEDMHHNMEDMILEVLVEVAMRKTLILFLVVHIKKLLILMAVFLSKTQEVFKQVSLLK